MKRIYFLIILLSVVCGVSAQETLLLPFDAVELTPEQKISMPVYLAYPLGMKNDMPIMKCDNIEAVDLGLSVKCATCNIGAEYPEDIGYYFAWGEIQRKVSYVWETYKWCRGSENTLTKYCTDSSCGTVDNKTILEQRDDAAAMNWGNEWRMPTSDEFKELKDSCDWVWTTQNGRNGYTITSRINGNSIFFPATGYTWMGNEVVKVNQLASYWSSSLYAANPIYAHRLYFGENNIGIDDDYSYRYKGYNIRPVCP